MSFSEHVTWGGSDICILNNDSAEVRDAAVGNIADDAEDEEEVEFNVKKGFFDLIALLTQVSILAIRH